MRAPPKLSALTQRLLDGPLAVTDNGESSLAIGPLSPVIEQAPVSKRCKLWELGDKHHCPVIGTCIPMDELVKFARRFHFSASLQEDFALHVEAVGWSHGRNEVSEAFQRHLDRKYQAQLQLFAKLKSETEVRQQWRVCLARGEVAGALWAAYTHKASTAETRHQLYADIHMLSHQVGAGQAADTRRLAQLEEEHALLKREQRSTYLAHQMQIDALQRENRTLSQQLAAAQAQQQEFEANRRRLAEFESGQVIVHLGRKLLELQGANEQLLAAAQRSQQFDKQLQASQEAQERLQKERDGALAERQAMEEFLTALAPAEQRCSGPADEDCAACAAALSSRCILYVGGRASMIGQYRQLADRLGITLVHHDGGLEESLSRLPELIHGADAVLCPTDNISHSAYYQVKSQCKRVGKPCLFYQGSGVSSFAVAMTRMSRGEFSLAGESQA
jgi:hypothetical protein